MLMTTTTGSVSSDQIEHHLKKISPVDIGQVDPQSRDVEFGSIITPDQIDPENSRWDLVPAYLS
jgi:hypothetical protein